MSNESISAIKRALSVIGRELKGLFFEVCERPVSKPLKEAPVKAEVAPETPTVEAPKPEAQVESALALAPAPAPAPAKPAPSNLKVCSKCKEKKPLDAEHFNRDSSKISGFKSCCKACSSRKEKHHECPGCLVSKPLTPEFWQRSSKSKIGFRTPCKDCLKTSRKRPQA
ncbi:hypothetical protein [Pseudomonas putida]|uniref:Uncharacterized protein n=1 Tax=Pseudomonas putida TaxID=303 RepID=A0A8I1EGZ6_PSEPU|nr:hypothetical protein [Pseudomonas putida]MBI6885092.1 hypothetical protein [Pseudomonas putida]